MRTGPDVFRMLRGLEVTRQSWSNEHIKPETPAARCTPASSGPDTLHENRPISVPFLAQECASPPAFAVKALHFVSMNAKPAALTARAAKRRRPPRRAFASFFQAKITRGKRKKEGTKCQKDNTRLGENSCGRRSKSRGECSKLIPPFTITASYVSRNIGTNNNKHTNSRHRP